MLFSHILLFVVAFLGAGINSIAGGGTLLTFPVMVFLGIAPITANATNNFAIVPGAISGAFSFRKYFPKIRRYLWSFGAVSFIGGLIGAIALLLTKEKIFTEIVPFLVLIATAIFAAHSFLGIPGKRSTSKSEKWWSTAIFFQFLIGIYGGYFGATIGIMMLANYAVLGFEDIHEMNALKTSMNAVINTTAVVYFSYMGAIDWSVAAVMALGGILGGYAGGKLAQSVSQATVRRAVVGVGFLASIMLFMKS